MVPWVTGIMFVFSFMIHLFLVTFLCISNLVNYENVIHWSYKGMVKYAMCQGFIQTIGYIWLCCIHSIIKSLREGTEYRPIYVFGHGWGDSLIIVTSDIVTSKSYSRIANDWPKLVIHCIPCIILLHGFCGSIIKTNRWKLPWIDRRGFVALVDFGIVASR